jgi:fructose-1-phosphate kinase PfkB-like protein
MAKILTLTLNPALDLTVELPRLEPVRSTAATRCTPMPPAKA